MNQEISIILACDQEDGIGKGGKLPWNYKDDMKFFSRTTKGSTCIMGRRTYEEIVNRVNPHPTKMLLSRRRCIVLSSDKNFKLQVERNSLDTFGVSTLHEALQESTEKVFIIGGSRMYDEGIKIADNVYITRISGSYDCDVFLSDEFTDYLGRNFIGPFRAELELNNKYNLTFDKYEKNR